jgi:hypothetical protein
MFCYTVATGLKCVLQELTMWSTISSEHPVFIKTVAKLTNKKLPSELTAELDAVREQFLKIKEETESLMKKTPMPRLETNMMPIQGQFPPDFAGVPLMPGLPQPFLPMEPNTWQQQMPFMPRPQMMPAEMMQPQMDMMYLNEVRRLIDRFMKVDNMFLGILDKVKKIGTQDEVWQTLLRHITDEQEYVYTLMEKLKPQLRKLR